MTYKKIVLAVLLILLIFLSVESISAENVTDTVLANDIDAGDSYLSDASMEADSLNEESQEVLSSSKEDLLSGDSEVTLPNIEKGVVSGGVDFTSIHPWAASDAVNGNKGGITYKIPSNATDIKSAYVYVNIYSGSGDSDRYGLRSNVTLTTADSTVLLGCENLTFTGNQMNDPTVYTINDHTTKVYSDYMIFYNVTDLLQGLSGTSVSVDVLSYPMAGKSFDGRIKLVSLFVAWEDGDSDEIYYWLNAGQAWTDDAQDGISHTFEDIEDLDFTEKQSILINVAASSVDAYYLINGMPFFSESETDEYINGAYYQYHKWDISNYIEPGDLEVGYRAVGGAYGESFKNLISILFIQDIPTYEDVQISLTPESSDVPAAYAGTNNTLTVKVTAPEGKYNIKLRADGKLVNQTEMNLHEGVNIVLLTDPTIRPVDEFTVNGAENKKVNYTVEVLSNGILKNSSSISIPILYNGNLGKDLAYPEGGLDSFLNITVNGDMVIDVQDNSHYISANILNRTEVWDVDLDDGSNIVKGFVYIPYYEFNSKTYVEDENMFNVTFNDVNIVPVKLYRDQSNLGRSYYSGYGVLVYDVTGLINKNGKNYLKLNKKFDTPAVYPSALIYMYNTTGSNSIKDIYIYNGADLLEGTSNNVAKRPVHADAIINVNSILTSKANLYVFAAGPQENEGNLVFNGEEHNNIWNATMASNEFYSLDITDSLHDSNSVSFVATGDRIIALQQIVVLEKNLDDLSISLESEYPNTCYAGTSNYITVTIEAVKNNKVTVALLANGVKVNETEIDLVYGLNNFTLFDPTIRPVDESTVNGAENKKVNYTVEVLSNGNIIDSSSIVLSVLYNGNLGKDLAYPAGGIDSFLNVTVNGDIVIDVKDDSSYLPSLGSNIRNDVWNVNLDSKSTIIKAFVYVPYSLADTKRIQENNMFKVVTFNDNNITHAALYRDQTNLGDKGGYGYGLLVYDVTDLLKNGENTFKFDKKGPFVEFYPSTLIYMYNTEGSGLIKNIYISNGADLLSIDSNRLVHTDSAINADSKVDVAKLYVFAANAQDGEGDIVFNGATQSNVWEGTSHSTDLYALDITNTIKNTNDISFVVNDGTILALQQMIVTTQKSQSRIIASDFTMSYNSNGSLIIGLDNGNGNAISNAKLNVVFNGNPTVLTTNEKGQVSLAIPSTLLPDSYDVSVSYEGDDNYYGSTKAVRVIVEKIPTQIIASDLTMLYNTKNNISIVLRDGNGNAISNEDLNVTFNGNSNISTTDKEGKITLSIPVNLIPDTYELSISYKGNDTHKESSRTINIIVEKIPTQIAGTGKTIVYNTNNKFTATLKDTKGNAIANAKVIIVLNAAKKEVYTNANGQVTLDIPSNLIPGTYGVSISFDGDSTHSKSSASSTVVVKKASVKLTAKRKTFKAKVKIKKYTVTLKNNKGKPLGKVTLTLKIKGKSVIKATTNANGKATFKIKKFTKKGKFTAKITFKGSKCYNKLVKTVRITVKK